jgi:hypothetical protein
MKNLKNFLLISNGLAGDGLAYGALTDLPDWSFVGKFNSNVLQHFWMFILQLFTIFMPCHCRW